MTANMVLLGISAGRHDAALALHAGIAFAGSILGAFVGSRVAGRAQENQAIWPRRIRVTLAVELAVLTVFTAWWEAAGGHPHGAGTYGLLAVSATALGIQSAAVLRFGVTGLSTTYLTGTLTQFVANFGAATGRASLRQLPIFVALIVGGGLGAVLAIELPRLMPVIPLAVLAVVIVGSHVAFSDDS